MLELRDVTKTYNKGKPNEFSALNGVSLSIEPGKVTVLKGPSGSGKTTLLGIVGCMARPTSGRLFLDGREITSLPERFLTAIRRTTFGFIFQQFHLIRGLSVLDNVMVPALPTGEPRGAIRKRALELLDLLKLGGKAGARVEWLSGGEAQRVAIVRALINNPTTIIADEPTAHLDSKLSVELMSILEGLRTSGKTILVASHDPVVYESAMVERIVSMRDGRVIEA